MEHNTMTQPKSADPKIYLKKVLTVAKYFKIFPTHITNGRKLPRIKDWPNLATQDTAQILKWWKMWPSACVGVLTGQGNHIMVVDIDVKPDYSGFTTLEELPKELPSTFAQRTPRTGMHLFYTVPPGVIIPNGTDVLGKCIDIRGENGFVMFAPSPGYATEGTITSIAPAPDWLIEQVKKKHVDPEKQLLSGVKYDEHTIYRLLRDLKQEDFRDRHNWMRIIMGVKEASNGEDYGYNAVLTWSKQDAEYFGKDIEPDLKHIWNTVKLGKEGGITGGTLVHESRKAFVQNGVGFDSVTGPVPEVALTFSGKKKDRMATDDANIIRLLTIPRLQMPGATKISDNDMFGSIVFNELKGRAVFSKRPSWVPKNDSRTYIDEDFEDTDAIELMCKLQDKPFYAKFAKTRVRDAVEAAARRNRCNPVTGYLDSIKWDGKDRIETWLKDFAQGKDDTYTRAVCKKTLISAVARAYVPGCKADHVMVIEGKQGGGKSGLLAILGGEWYNDPPCPIGSIDSEQNIQGLWIVEMGEMWSITSKREAGAVKDFISNQAPHMRKSYGHYATSLKRRCIFIGTINLDGDGSYLNDPTGNRRFWPVTTPTHETNLVDFKGLKETRDQLWAEAVHRFKAGEHWHLTPAETKLANIEQKKRQVSHAWEDDIRKYLYKGEGASLPYVQSSEIAKKVFGVDAMKLNQASRTIGSILRSMGWESKTVRLGHTYQTVSAFDRPIE